MSLKEPILNIFNREKKLVKADDFYNKLKNKKIKFKRLHGRSWKYFQNNFKNAKFWFFDFHQNINLEVVLPTFKYKKWLFWIILSIFALEIFSIGLLVFSLKGFENPQNRIFSKKADFFKKSNFEDFQRFSSPFREKTKSPMKKISGTRNAYNYPKHSFFILRS